MSDVLVVGSLSLDVIVRGAVRERRLGGVVTYAGLTYRRAGLATAVAFNLRAADRPLVAPLERAGLGLLVGPSAETTSCVNLLEGEGRRQEMPRRARPIAPEDLVPAGAPRLVHLGPLHPDDIEASVPAALAAPGRAIAADLQGLARHVEGGRVQARCSPQAGRFLASCDFLKGDEDEVETVAAGLGLAPAALLAALGVEELVVTAGGRGGRVLTRAGEQRYEGVSVVASDPTGAGDVFFAAYLVARLLRGASPGEAAGHAASVAADHVRGRHLDVGELALGE
jgi:sugar/nucleoside kinase (ribokinase family)